MPKQGKSEELETLYQKPFDKMLMHSGTLYPKRMGQEVFLYFLPQIALFQYVLQTHLQNGPHMIVRKRVKNIFPLPAVFD